MTNEKKLNTLRRALILLNLILLNNIQDVEEVFKFSAKELIGICKLQGDLNEMAEEIENLMSR